MWYWSSIGVLSILNFFFCVHSYAEKLKLLIWFCFVWFRKMPKPSTHNCCMNQSCINYCKEEVNSHLDEFVYFGTLCLLLSSYYSLGLNVFGWLSLIWKLEYQTRNGPVSKESTMSLWWIYLVLVLRIYSIFVIGNCPSKLFSCLLIKW